MVDISKALTSANHVSKFAPDARLPYMVEVVVTAAQMIAAKGSALAAADVFDIIKVPAGTVIRGVWARKTAAMTGTSTDLALHVGFTGGTTNVFVNAWDYDAAAVGSYGTLGAGVVLGSVSNATQTVSLLINAMTGTWLTGSITFYVECIDLSDNRVAGTVQLGS